VSGEQIEGNKKNRQGGKEGQPGFTMVNAVCNSTLEDLRSELDETPANRLRRPLTKWAVTEGSEIKLLGPLTFHDLALIIGGSCAIIAISLSLYLVFMHAINYTKPREQKQ
jgi:hypothetical protein